MRRVVEIKQQGLGPAARAVEDIMPTTNDPVAAHASASPNAQAPHDTAERISRAQAAPCLATIETVAGGAVAVTRPGMPRIFRLLLALTGVRV
jgi:hypothetical protein